MNNPKWVALHRHLGLKVEVGFSVYRGMLPRCLCSLVQIQQVARFLNVLVRKQVITVDRVDVVPGKSQIRTIRKYMKMSYLLELVQISISRCS